MVAAVAAAAALTCRPEAGLGTAAYTRGAVRHVLDLATCRDRAVGTVRAVAHPVLRSPDGRRTATIVATRSGKAGLQRIVVRERRTGKMRTVLRVRESYRRVPAGTPGPLGLVDWSPDGRWLFYYVDPMGSQSLAADGLALRAVSVAGGRTRTIGTMLMNDDYRTWCGDTLVYTGGGNRLATTNKRLLAASGPTWRPHPLVVDARQAWGSLTCAPDGHSVVVQSQPRSGDYNFSHTRWSLWHVGLDGSRARLTSPPAHFADESPRFGGGTLFFVRTRDGRGTLYALRKSRVVGPFASLGFSLGYYGHHAWPYTVRR